MAIKKAGAKKSKAVTKKTMKRVMHEFKEGGLKSGGKRKVTNPKQAIAIGLSEARQAGAKVPAKKKSAKAAKKSSGKSTAKKR